MKSVAEVLPHTVEERALESGGTSNSAALFTVSAVCPAPRRAVANRSRTKAVSSATMTVLVVVTVAAVT